MSRPDYRAIARKQPRPARLLTDILDRPSDVIWLLPQDFVVCLREATKYLRDEGNGPPFNCQTLHAFDKTVRLAKVPR